MALAAGGTATPAAAGEGGVEGQLRWVEAAQPVERLCAVALQCREEGAPTKTPGELTYGELPLRQLRSVLAQVAERGGLREGGSFYDLGSGGGKLVLGAGLLCPQLGTLVGIELLQPLVAEAEALRGRALSEGGARLSEGQRAACAAARFVAEDVLDTAALAAAGADCTHRASRHRAPPHTPLTAPWRAGVASAAAGSAVLMVNGLCFSTSLRTAICERLAAASSTATFVASTSPLPLPTEAFELVFTNEDVRTLLVATHR